ncbi:MAG: hypothetical protein WBM41_16895, partial [Arenicellales bacterium]
MSIKIEKKIVGYDVVTPQDKQESEPEKVIKETIDSDIREQAKIVQMHEKVVRPEMLIGSTYKIKTPVSEHAFYITINDM